MKNGEKIYNFISIARTPGTNKKMFSLLRHALKNFHITCKKISTKSAISKMLKSKLLPLMRLQQNYCRTVLVQIL